MESQNNFSFLTDLGLIAGVAGIALGIFVYLFREVIGLKIFAQLTKRQSYLIIVTFLVLVWSISIYSIYKYFSVNGSNSITVLVHGEKGIDDLLLQNRGIVTLQYGDATVEEMINTKGEATFKQIGDAFFKPDSKVKIFFKDPLGEPYHSVNPDSVYVPVRNTAIYLEIGLFGIDEFKGIVTDSKNGQPIDSARISISDKVYTFTDKFGEFTLTIPKKNQSKFQTIRVNRSGYEFMQLQNVPLQTASDLPIQLNPMKANGSK